MGSNQTLKQVCDRIIRHRDAGGNVNTGTLWEKEAGAISWIKRHGYTLDTFVEKHLHGKVRLIRSKEKWSKEAIIQSLKKRASEGKSLARADLKVEDPKLFSACNKKRYFGSLPNACVAAGFTRDGKVSYTAEIVMSRILGLCNESGQVSRAAIWNSSHGIFPWLKRNKYTIESFLLAHSEGQVFLQEKPQSWTKAKVITELQAWAVKGKSLSSSDMRRENGALEQATYRHFGTFTNAIESAGLIPASKSRNKAIGGIKTRGLDGYLYDSKYEAEGGNILFCLKNEGIVIDYIAHPKLDIQKGKHENDFWVNISGYGGMLFEADGYFKGDRPNKMKFDQKLKWMEERGIPCIVYGQPGQLRKYIIELSGTGTFRDKPVASWNVMPRDAGQFTVTEAEIISELARIRDLALDNRKYLTRLFFDDHKQVWMIGSAQITRWFGDWNTALRLVSALPARAATESELINELTRIESKIGRQPLWSDVVAHSPVDPKTIARVLGSGSFVLACQRAGQARRAPERLSNESLCERIREIHSRNPSLDYKEMDRADKRIYERALLRFANEGKRREQVFLQCGLAVPPSTKPWARNYDHCVKCGSTTFKHNARGYCQRCYERV